MTTIKFSAKKDGQKVKVELSDDNIVTVNSPSVGLDDVFPKANELKAFMSLMVKIKNLLHMNGVSELTAKEKED